MATTFCTIHSIATCRSPHAQQIHRLFTADVQFEAQRLKFAMAFVAEELRAQAGDPYVQFGAAIDQINTQVIILALV